MLRILNREDGYPTPTPTADEFCRSDKTINAEHAINPAQNGSLESDIEDEKNRRRMDAGDCECCRDVSTNYSIHQCD
jgi:hypothetical protein